MAVLQGLRIITPVLPSISILLLIIPAVGRAQAPGFDGLDSWIRDQRPAATAFESQLPDYPEWLGACPNNFRLTAAFASEFKRECVQGVFNSKVATAKKTASDAYDEVLKCTGAVTDPMAVMTSGRKCVDQAKGLKKQGEDLIAQAKKLPKDAARLIREGKRLISVGSVVVTLWGELGVCSAKAMVASGDMTRRQKDDWKGSVDRLFAVKDLATGAFEKATDLANFTGAIAQKGMDMFRGDQAPKTKAEAEKLWEKIKPDTLAKDLDALIEALEPIDLKRIRLLEEKGQALTDKMNACQVDEALSDLEIYQNNVYQEFLEQRTAIALREKNLWCSALARGYDRAMNDYQQRAFLFGSVTGMSPSDREFGTFYNPARDNWKQDLKNQDLLIEKINGIYQQLTPENVQKAREYHAHEEALAKDLVGLTRESMKQCGAASKEDKDHDLGLLARRFERARDSACGKAVLAEKYNLDAMAEGTRQAASLTSQAKRISTSALRSADIRLKACKPTDAMVGKAKSGSQLLNLQKDANKIGLDLDSCYLEEFDNLEARIDSRRAELASIAASVDKKIQLGRRALETCETDESLPALRKARLELTGLACNTTPGAAKRLREIDNLERALAPDSCKGVGVDKVYFLIRVTGSGLIPHYAGGSFITSGTYEKIITLQRDDPLVKNLTEYRDRLAGEDCPVEIPAIPGLNKLPVLWTSGPQVTVAEGPALSTAELTTDALMDTWRHSEEDGPSLGELRKKTGCN